MSVNSELPKVSFNTNNTKDRDLYFKLHNRRVRITCDGNNYVIRTKNYIGFKNIQQTSLLYSPEAAWCIFEGLLKLFQRDDCPKPEGCNIHF